MQKIILILLFLICGFLFSCSHNSNKIKTTDIKKNNAKESLCEECMKMNKKNDDEVVVISIIKEYINAAKRYHYADGSMKVYDSIVMKIEEPEEFKGQLLVYYFDDVLPDNSPWRDLDRRATMLIKRDAMINEDELVLYDGNTREICICGLE